MTSSRTRGYGYGSLGGSEHGDPERSQQQCTPDGGSRQRPRWPWLRIGIASIAVVAILCLLRASRATSPPGRDPVAFPAKGTNNLLVGSEAPQVSVEAKGALATVGSEDDELTFVSSNEYTRRGDIVGRGYPWLQDRVLVEPFRKTTLSVVGPREGMSYTWQIAASDPDAPVTHNMPTSFSGADVEVVFERSPEYTIVLEERADLRSAASSATMFRREDESDEEREGAWDGEGEGGVMRSTTVVIFCKYVRREIRSLFDDERAQLFDAMKVLWDVRIEEGQALYGPDYLDVWTIDKFHQVGASDIECDHLHDGIGFGVSHSMVTMMFENSLQLVNPMLSLPYWDFTVEGSIIDTDEEFRGDYSRLAEATSLWTTDWFGGVDAEDFQVKDGRWGYIPVPIVKDYERVELSADVYSRMRAPWNVNSRTYLTRGLGEMCGIHSTLFYAWPGCQTHYELQDIFTSYYGYTWWSQYSPHGPVHVWVGGNLDCKRSVDKMVDIVGEDYRVPLSGYMFVKRKDMYRDHMFKCSGYSKPSVSEEEIMKSGQCGCVDLDLSEGSEDYLSVFDDLAFLLELSGRDFTEEEKLSLAVQWCNGQISMGESSQSNSPIDPTFWSMHPTMERLLAFKLLSGTFTDYSWPDEAGAWTGMDGIEYDVKISTRSDDCNGHRGSDIFPYDITPDLITPQFTFYGRKAPNTLQNRMLIKLFDPNENALPYIYDNFEWPHCAAMGFDFSDFFDTKTMKPGPKGSAAARVEKDQPGRVHGFGLFERGTPHGAPGADPPAAVKKVFGERNARRQ